MCEAREIKLMSEKKDLNNEAGTIEVVVLLKKEAYESMEEISTKLGMDLPSWVNHVLLSKVKGNQP